MTTPALIVHGGTGNIPLEDHPAMMDGTRHAAEIAWKLFISGGSALDAVEAAVRALEDNPAFNAGRGSVLNSRGEIEMDALIMDGATLDLGAVIAVQNVANPITLARYVMTRSPHKVLAAAGAREFATKMGIPFSSLLEMSTPRSLKRYQERRARGENFDPSTHKGTVGAVALDRKGNLAAATSTGGVAFKLPGRVGDSPLVGAGAYADNQTGAASATGDGEQIMRVLLCKTATDAIGQGMNAQAAAEYAVRIMVERVNGRGGIIVVDRNGTVGFAHVDPSIAVAWVQTDGSIQTAMSKE